MTDNKKTKERSQESKVKKIITTIVYYLFKCITEKVIEKIIEYLFN